MRTDVGTLPKIQYTFPASRKLVQHNQRGAFLLSERSFISSNVSPSCKQDDNQSPVIRHQPANRVGLTRMQIRTILQAGRHFIVNG
jgi:hypothetical protein